MRLFHRNYAAACKSQVHLSTFLSFSFHSKVTYIVCIPKPSKLPLTQTICDLLGKNNSYQGLLKKDRIFPGIIVRFTKENKTCQNTGNSGRFILNIGVGQGAEDENFWKPGVPLHSLNLELNIYTSFYSLSCHYPIIH